MNRRSFLKALGAALGAAAVVDVPSWVLPLPPPPVIDWTAWNTVELRSGLAGVTARINGIDVTPYHELMGMVARAIRIDHQQGLVAFSAFDASLGSGFRVDVPDMEGMDDIVVGCTMKLSGPAMQTVTDLYVAEKPGLTFKDVKEPCLIGGVTIEGVVPYSSGDEWEFFDPQDT